MRWNWQGATTSDTEQIAQVVEFQKSKETIPTQGSPQIHVSESLEIHPMTPFVDAQSNPITVEKQNISSSSSSAYLSTPMTFRKYRSLTNLYETCGFALLTTDPTTFVDAQMEEKWQNAILEELDVINKNHTWQLRSLPAKKKKRLKMDIQDKL